MHEFRRNAVIAYLDAATSAEDEVWEDKAGRLQLDPRIEWWQPERDRRNAPIAGMHKTRIDERRVRLEEA